AEEVVIETSQARFSIRVGGPFPFTATVWPDTPAASPVKTSALVVDAAGHSYHAAVRSVRVEEAGPLRACVQVPGSLHSQRDELAEVQLPLHFFAGSATVRLSFTIRNPRRADHPGGLWDLGNHGSIYLRELSFRFSLEGGGAGAAIHYSTDAEAPFSECQ